LVESYPEDVAGLFQAHFFTMPLWRFLNNRGSSAFAGWGKIIGS
jgi:hypothetical protein